MTRLQRPGRWSTISCLLAVGFVILGMGIPRVVAAQTPAQQAVSEAAPVPIEESSDPDGEDTWIKSG